MIEYPTRLSKQLLKLAYALAITRGKTEITDEELITVKRVGRDTCVPNRIKILEIMRNTSDQYKTSMLADQTKKPLVTCWRELKEMEYLGVVDYEKVEESAGAYGSLKHFPEKDGWRLLDSKLLNLLPVDNDTELCHFTNVPPEGVEGKGKEYMLGGKPMKCTPFISVVRLESAPEDNQGECISCHRRGVMEFHAFHPDGSFGFLCAECGLEEMNKLARNPN